MAKVIVYSASWCKWCRKTKDFLKKNKIKFEDRDVEADSKNAEEMVRKSKQSGIPVIDVDGEIIIGFDEAALRRALGIKE